MIARMNTTAPPRDDSFTGERRIRIDALGVAQRFTEYACHRRSTELALATCLIERESDPLMFVNRELDVILMNRAAEQLVDRGDVVGIKRRRLSFVARAHRAGVQRALQSQGTDPVSIADDSNVISVRRLSVNDSCTDIFLISVSAVAHSSNLHLRGKFGLTASEAEVATAIARGASLATIARERQTSLNTVKTQVRMIYQKCGVHSQVQLTGTLSQIQPLARDRHPAVTST